jgi:hypothetical protein
MPGWAVALLAAAGTAALVLAFLAYRSYSRRRWVARAVIADPEDHTVLDRSGAVRSVQAADLTLPREELERMWTPENLERLARTYWRFLSRCTLGLIRVAYTPGERFVVLLFRPLVLLSFQAPEYEMNADRGIVRWRIEKGILVSRRGRGGDGYLQIDVRRRPEPDENDCVTVHVEVEVANFYPAIASALSTRIYKATQSWIHVVVTHGFLRSLARLDLAESRVGRLARHWAGAPAGDEVGEPPPGERPGSEREPARQGAVEEVR